MSIFKTYPKYKPKSLGEDTSVFCLVRIKYKNKIDPVIIRKLYSTRSDEWVGCERILELAEKVEFIETYRLLKM